MVGTGAAAEAGLPSGRGGKTHATCRGHCAHTPGPDAGGLRLLSHGQGKLGLPLFCNKHVLGKQTLATNFPNLPPEKLTAIKPCTFLLHIFGNYRKINRSGGGSPLLFLYHV